MATATTTLTGAALSAYDLMNETLASWGLSSLAGTLKQLIVGGDTDSNELSLALSQTAQYKQRFSGNAIREKNGLEDLSPASYIALEDSYRQVLTQYGMPAGFYSSPSDFANWIGGDVSADELGQRAQIASTQYQNAPQAFKDYWSNYGLTSGDAVASILDPTHESLATLQDQANAVNIGGTAAQNGLNVTGARALDLANQGVTLAQAQSAYQRIAAYGQTDSQIAQRFGTSFDQNDEENDLLLNQGQTTAKRSLIYSEEAAQFSGRGGASQESAEAGANY